MDRVKGILYNLATDRNTGFFASIAKFFLWLAACGYGLAVRYLAWSRALTAVRLPCKVISVGNITLGGTGKTILVEYIARCLTQEGHRVAVLSRGYKRKYRVPPTAYREKTGEATYIEMGDEPAMLQMKLKGVPVVVDPDRVRAARQAIAAYGVDTLILDDGFQQWKLKKDLDIMSVDAGSAFGNRQVIPRGILREPLSALKRADVFVITKTNLNPCTAQVYGLLAAINPKAPVFEAEYLLSDFYSPAGAGFTVNKDSLKGKKTALVSGIGDPASFEKLMAQSGVDPARVFIFPDHHPYTKADAERIFQECRRDGIDTIITTEKDSVRFLPVAGAKPRNLQIWVARIALGLKNDEQGFFTRLRGLHPA